MAHAHSRRPSMACLCVPHADRPACEDTAKAMSPIVRRESPSWRLVWRPKPLRAKPGHPGKLQKIGVRPRCCTLMS
ncbi:MAG: hypothetical protein U9P07_07645 [Pseudomonadota bacterium]|nr:hypothetical protein [Pseudomonadota bacterium]